ncbi:hypothetical protein GGX14DRAFT_566103 [Mycena pura]|uniref:Uncharacterized protein n=1 Tax=Mycena pura TaxID=153505 RepID=A0AAD6VF53_9AGAR|nr:hypothetical protein GGX14DRAFT_566103 [Mycena pura]
MPSILQQLQSRGTIRYVGSRCYNQNYELITCPISLPKLIVIGVLIGLLLLICGTLFILSRCTCSCRRNRGDPASTLPAFPRATGGLAPYASLPESFRSTDTLVEPEKIHPASHLYHARPYV